MKWLVWLCRIIVGTTFIFSGFVKAIDPWGFVYKIGEYLTVWGWDFSRETVVCAAIAGAAVEFTLGILLISGCMRRFVPWALAAFMAVMLPLTAYIFIADPVADCGCFGDAWIISNGATLAKNVVLTALIVFLILYNTRVGGIFANLTQWMVTTASGLYCLIVSIIGYNVQPLIDFRPYHVGSSISDDTEYTLTMIYEKDGVRREFPIDALPDDTWTFVDRSDSGSEANNLALYDHDGDDVTADVFDTDGELLMLVVPNPAYHERARSGMANRLSRLMSSRDGTMIAAVAAYGPALDRWVEKARADYPVYSADDTALKELARGDASLVLIDDGIIKWKRNIFSLPGDFPDNDADAFSEITAIEEGPTIYALTIGYIIILALIFGMRFLRRSRPSQNAPAKG